MRSIFGIFLILCILKLLGFIYLLFHLFRILFINICKFSSQFYSRCFVATFGVVVLELGVYEMNFNPCQQIDF